MNDIHDLLGAYCTDALDADERAAFEEHLATCVECRDETPVLESAWQKYADQGVVVLGVAYADVEPNSLAYMDDFGVSFPHAPDLGTDISQTYEITGVPETFIIDKEGVIRHVQIGAVNEAMLDQIIPQLLAQ